jgi:hypothetical protein
VLETRANGGHVPVAPREMGANQRAKREQMRAVSRFGTLLLAGALAFAPAAALAQQAPAPASDTPATDAIGPRELQNFSLNGTVTRAADQPVPVATAPKSGQQRSGAQSAQSTAQPATSRTETAAAPAARTPAPTPSPAPRQVETAAADTPRAAAPEHSPEPLRQSQPASSVTVALPSLGDSAGSGSAAASPGFAPEPATGTLAPEHRFPVLPWLLAALVIALGGGFFFWRNRQREAFASAGGPQIDAFVAPEPAPVPRPAPPAPAPKAPTPPATGIVSTRLRPWMDIGFRPLRCILEDERVTVEFELELFNSGSAPARAVLAEASLFNAGAAQEREIAAFFANPVAQGERIQVIPPLKRVGIKTQVVAPRAHIQAYQLAGHEVFVPVIGFNALYSWSGGEGQTSVSYLLGRDTKGEKMGPFRLDLGPRIFRGLAAKLLPAGVRQ